MSEPTVGEPLPRAADAYVEAVKWHGYVLADGGHGPHWARVFRVDRRQADELWQAVRALVLTAPVTELRPTAHGIGCGVSAQLTFNGRTAVVALGWIYDAPDAPPRLVTAYPAP
jgi:hypothetical protein